MRSRSWLECIGNGWYCHVIYIIMCTGTKHDVGCKYLLKYRYLLTFFHWKFWWFEKKVIPLHPLSRTNETSSKTRLRSVREGDKERVLWKDLHKTDKVVQEARMMKHSFLGRRKTNRQVCLTLDSNLEARSETDTNKCSLSNKVSSKRYFTM